LRFQSAQFLRERGHPRLGGLHLRERAGEHRLGGALRAGRGVLRRRTRFLLDGVQQIENERVERGRGLRVCEAHLEGHEPFVERPPRASQGISQRLLNCKRSASFCASPQQQKTSFSPADARLL